MIRVLGPTPADVLEVAAELTGVSAEEIVGPALSALVLKARLVTCWAMRHATQASFPEIGRAIDRDHRTVMSNCDNVAGHPELLRAAERIVSECRGRFEEFTPCPPSDQQVNSLIIDCMERKS